MSADIPRELMILVERVVRPLPIPLARQKRLRAEFLQHLQAIYAEELARDGDSAAALSRAQERFGDVAELTRELGGTVSWRERSEHWLEVWTAQRATESVSRYAIRMFIRFVQLEAVLFCFTLLVMLDHHFFGSVRISVQSIGAVLGIFLYLTGWMCSLLMFGLNLGAEFERPTRRWTRIVLLSIGLLATFSISVNVMYALAAWSEAVIPHLAWIGGGVTLLLIAMTFGVLHHRENKYRREWAELKIDGA